MAGLDLVIRGGQIVTAGATATADIGIAGGTIVQIGGELHAEHEIDATGKLLLPGGVDAHVHLSTPPGERSDPEWVDDFTSGSAAALAGGITTLGNMTFLADGELPLAGLAREAAVARSQAIADFFLHPVLNRPTPQALDEIRGLRAAGCNSIKIFMSAAQFDPQVQGFVEATRRAGDAGMLTLIHCEDHALIEDATAQLVQQGRTALRYYQHSRPVIAEVVATERAVAIAEATGAPVYIVHLSSARALEVCAAAQARGVPVYVETRPLYLHLTAERFLEQEGAKYLGQPPLREPHDVDALWHGLRQGTVHTVCTDHAPWSLAAKLDPALSITNLRPGVENLQTLMPMLYSEGVRTGRLSLQRFVEVTSTNAARLFGLYPRKGTIGVGGDADIVLFDPTLTRRITRAMLKSRCDYSPYDGWEVTGWPVLTLRRGEIVFADDEVIGHAGSGMLMPRAATGSL
ncbi:MAG TPA: amidohydrolase family protein [Chloroflexota bacterium]|nr:amidohydrolase family protein [Chloroflexota bacterium]